MINLLVKFEPIFIFIFTCKCNLHVFFIFVWWPNFLWLKNLGNEQKEKIHVIMKLNGGVHS